MGNAVACRKKPWVELQPPGAEKNPAGNSDQRWSELEQAQWRHDDVIKWNHFLRYWPFAQGIHRFLVNPPHKGQWRGALMFCLICVWINSWVNNSEAADLRCYRAYYDISVMSQNNMIPYYEYKYTTDPVPSNSICENWIWLRTHIILDTQWLNNDDQREVWGV